MLLYKDGSKEITNPMRLWGDPNKLMSRFKSLNYKHEFWLTRTYKFNAVYHEVEDNG